MPILVNSSNFTDAFGNSTTFYRSNAGDETTLELNVSSLIRMTSVGNSMSIDTSLNQVTIGNSQLSWLTEGFRVGDEVGIFIYNSNGSLAYLPYTTSITYVDDLMCDFSSISQWYSVQAQQFVVIIALNTSTLTDYKQRQELLLFFNHSKNSIPGNVNSLIDGEQTRALMTSLHTMTVSSTVNASLVGKQSGQFLKEVSITRNANDSQGWLNYTISLVFDNSGMFDESWFFGGEALKSFVKMEWSTVSGESFARAISKFDQQGNTGFFDEPHNTSVADSTLIQGVSTIDYSVPTTFDVIVDGPTTEIGIGGCYISIDDTYYKNKVQSQRSLSMISPTTDVATTTQTSIQNPSGAGYEFEINSVSTLGSVTTVNITFTPNAAFTTFIDGRDGDRLFYAWIKCGNINHLFFADQLTKAPVIGQPITMEQDYGYLDHSENVETATGNLTGFIADTEDDVAYIGAFKLTNGDEYQSFRVKLEAFNTTTEESFTLQQAFFSFSGVQVNSSGKYLLNEAQTVVGELPLTSVKRQAKLTLEPTLDSGADYGVKIYAPWLLNWRDWIPLIGANVAFYPTQNNNWQQYSNNGDWVVRTRLELTNIDGITDYHNNEITIRDYDADADVTTTIELYQYPSMQQVTAVPNTGLILVRAEHELAVGSWHTSDTWGMNTVEEFEQSPRIIASSVVDIDGQQSTLLPETGLLVPITYPSANVARLESILDCSTINVSAGVSFGAKIKDSWVDDHEYLIMPDSPKVPIHAIGFIKFSHPDVRAITEPCIRVRRSHDNAESDIGYMPKAGGGYMLDTVGLMSFVTEDGNYGESYGYVVNVYDDSGNDNYVWQSTTVTQMMIVDFGTLVTDSTTGRPQMKSVSNDYYFVLNPINTGTSATQMHFGERTATGTVNIGLGNSSANQSMMWWNSANNIYVAMTSYAFTPADTTTGSLLITTLIAPTNISKVWLNTTPLTVSSATRTTSSMEIFGRMNTQNSNQPIQGNVLWTIDVETEVPAFQALLMSEFGI